MKSIVTGASSGIGLAISKMLINEGYEVFGFGRSFNNDAINGLCQNTDNDADTEKTGKFHAVECDLLDTGALLSHIKQISKDHDVKILVNNAGAAYYGLHEEINADQIANIVRTNLELPMILSGALLRTLKENKGFIINISSITATQSNPHGCAYGATKAGLSNFSKSLFEENRKYGLKVINIQPDMTSTNLYRNASFKEDEDILAHLEPEEVADTVRYALNAREGLVLTDITLRPQLHRIARKPKK